MFIPKYEYCYAQWRYHTFNLPEEIMGLIGEECYGGGNYPDKICEPKYDIEEKNPNELKFAKEYFLENSISYEVPTINSPDDLQKLSTFGSYVYDSLEGGGVATMEYNPSIESNYVNVGVDNATYPLRDGYYRVEIIIENRKGETSFQHFSGCDNYSYPVVMQEGEIKTLSFPFYYDSGASCSNNEDHFLFKLKSTENGGQCVIRKVKLYEVQKA